MLNLMVKSKLHRVTVTDANLAYRGSVTIDRRLMKAANIKPYEFVHVNNLSNAVHWETYAIEGDDGQIVLNGPPARLFQPGDKVVVLAFNYLSPEEMDNFTHIDVMVDEKNNITDVISSKSEFKNALCMEVVLVSYRDAGMRTFTYFWAHKDSNRQFGPFFDTEADAKRWLEETLGKPNSEKG